MQLIPIKGFVVKFIKVPVPSFLNWGVVISLLEFCLLKSIININFSIKLDPMILISPAVVVLILFVKLNDEQILLLKWNLGALVLNLISLVGFIWLTYQVNGVYSGVLRDLWIVVAGIVFFSGIFSRVSLKEFLFRLKTRRELWFSAFLTGTCFFGYNAYKPLFWSWLVKPTGWGVSKIGIMFGIPISEIITEPAAIIVKIPWGKIRIIEGCSGLEGVALFLWFFGIILILDGEKISRSKKSAIIICGIVYMLTLNMLRIVSFLGFGAGQFSRLGKTEALKSQVQIFHSSAGWTLYLLGLGLFFICFYRLLFSKKSSNPK